MRGTRISKNTSLFLLVLIITIVLYKSVSRVDTFATSPQFGLQAIIGHPFQWYDMNNNYILSFAGDPSTSIVSVDYFSNSRTLNATLWLLAPFNETISNNDSVVNYGMLVDADADNKTGLNGADYQVIIHGQNGTWSKVFLQYSSYSPTEANRTISEEDNYDYKKFTTKDGRYVVLSADLTAMGSPSKYRVAFYTEQKKASMWLMDFTNWIHIPTPEFEVVPSPSSIDLRQGDKNTVLVQVKSDTGFRPLLHLFTDNRNMPAGINLKFNSSYLSIPPSGISTANLDIQITENTPTRKYMPLIFANATFPSESFIPANSSQSYNIPIFLAKSEDLSSQSKLMLNVAPALTPMERIRDFLNTYQVIISLLPLSFAGGVISRHVGPWIANKVKKTIGKMKKQYI
jgi:hypothetical protein